jgi:hypothetical protein
MRKQKLLSAVFLLCAFIFSATGSAQDCNPVKQARLKEMLVQLGFTVKDLVTTPGKEKYEIKTTKDGLDVPIAYEISGSTNYIWLTVLLGKPPAEGSVLNASLLKQNAKIQPCQFYVTEAGNLMMGLAVDNRGVNNALLRRYTEFVTGKVTETKSFWQY